MNTDRFKFRAWDTKEQKWIGIWIFRGGHTEERSHYREPDIFSLADRFSSNVVFMQCTGLTDSEGNLIYEGDIVEVILNKNYPTPHVCTIVYKGMGFWFMDEDEELFVFHPETYHLTVIGNAYELQS